MGGDLDAMMVFNNTDHLSPIISNEFRQIVLMVNRTILGQIVTLLGMTTNVINLLVFYKMGYRDSINVSLSSLAVSDFMSCLTQIWVNLCYTPAFNTLDLPFHPLETYYLTGGRPHLIFVKISGLVTAYIAFERCLCVTFPLKVKNMISPKRTTIVVVCIYVFVLGLFASSYYTNRLAFKFFPRLNKTLLGIVYSHDRADIERWMIPLRGVSFHWLFFIIVIVCTIVLVVSLRRKAEWRTTATAPSTSNSNRLSSRDAKVSKMVVIVSVIFIVCMAPTSIGAVAMSLEPEISLDGRYSNLMSSIFSFSALCNCINTCVNIFIYYSTSSNYKTMFHFIFFRTQIKN